MSLYLQGIYESAQSCGWSNPSPKLCGCGVHDLTPTHKLLARQRMAAQLTKAA